MAKQVTQAPQLQPTQQAPQLQPTQQAPQLQPTQQAPQQAPVRLDWFYAQPITINDFMPAAPIVAPQHATRRGVNKVYPRVFGKYSVVRTLHWLGYNGYSKAQAVKALGLAGVADVNPATITTGLADGRNPNYAKPAPLTESEAAQLAAWARS